jgi:predicted porin
MFGGVRKAGWATILASGVLLGGGFSAQAADLGGDCCGDLEERIAELEATTARKGNRKVSLTISGWVNEQVLFWDDSNETNIYVGNNDQERSRFKFAGEAKIDNEWSAGYTIEIGVRSSKSSSYNQNDDDGGTNGALDLRKSSWFIKSKKLGKVTVGLDGSATYHILDDADITNTRYYADAESMPTIGATGFNLVTSAGTTALTWGSILSPGATRTPGNGERPNIIRYETPDFSGFSAVAAYGEDDLWDVAAIYKGKLGDFDVAGRVGYAEYTDEKGSTGGLHCYGPTGSTSVDIKCREFGASGTIWHKPSGLYVYGAYGQKQDDRDSAKALPLVDDEDQIYYIQAGIEKTWIPLGSTTVFGTYRHDDNGTQGGATISKTNLGLPNTGNFYIGSAELDTWGGGVVQNISSAAMDLYLIYSHVDGEFDAVCNSATCGGLKQGDSQTVDLEALQLIQAGARIQF